ncbi:MAG: C4-dicarboxylate TRAP transporter substrate-binding protein [Rhodospirillales bacterium]|nr:C4-dicarboxylate TRAP transporter substrate-binding protein [Rhodospirillales bacterium]
MRSFRTGSSVLALAALLAATPFLAEAKSTLRIGTVLAAGDPLMVAAQQMKKDIEAATKGEVEVQVFPSSQLGDTQAMMDQAQAGANVGTFVEGSRLAPHIPEFNVLVAPYAFNTVDELARFVETPTFQQWNDKLKAKTGLTLLSFNWYQGARHMLTKKPVATPADLKGVRVRTIGEPLWIKTIGAMGAVPTPLAWAEVYPSLQTGVIDGAEAQPSAIRGAKLFEVVSHITLTEHIFLMSGLVVSDKWLQSLPEAHRKVVVAEAKKSGAAALKAKVEQADQIFTEIKAKGVKVSPVDKTPFRNAVQPVYGELGLTDLVAQARKAIGN